MKSPGAIPGFFYCSWNIWSGFLNADMAAGFRCPDQLPVEGDKPIAMCGSANVQSVGEVHTLLGKI